MPGIAGIVSRYPGADLRRPLAQMLDSMRHEPFYVSGTCSAPELGLYAGWVAHEESFAAGASTAPNGGVGLVFAGECVNQDDESILSRYERLGERCVRDLNGLFSGFVVDWRRRRAVLFNDRYGVERVYVHETDEATYFASEAKALLSILPALRSFDDSGVAEFLTFGCTLGGKTLFRGIEQLDSASLWIFDHGRCRKSRYFTAAEWEQQPALSGEAFQGEFNRTFQGALPRYLHGAQIGISLTGGLDTRMIMACLPSLSRPPICYTFAGMNGATLDSSVAARVASASRLPHRLLRIRHDFLSEYGAYVDRTVFATDACAGATTAHELYLNAQARDVAGIRLTGNFGSEVLRGVSTFKPLHLTRELITADLQPELDAVVAQATKPDHSPVTFAAFREIPWNLFGPMAAAKSQLTLRTPYLDNDLVGLAYRAPAALRQSPDLALQLVRVAQPGLSTIATDRAVLSGASGLGYSLKRLFAEFTFKLDYLYAEAMPSPLTRLDSPMALLGRVGLLGLHKYLPYRRWFRNELASYVASVLTDSSASRQPYWNVRFLKAMADDHTAGRRNFVREINAVLTLLAAERLLLQPGRNESRLERCGSTEPAAASVV